MDCNLQRFWWFQCFLLLFPLNKAKHNFMSISTPAKNSPTALFISSADGQVASELAEGTTGSSKTLPETLTLSSYPDQVMTSKDCRPSQIHGHQSQQRLEIPSRQLTLALPPFTNTIVNVLTTASHDDRRRQLSNHYPSIL